MRNRRLHLLLLLFTRMVGSTTKMPPPTRIIFAFTTTNKRIEHIRPVLESVVERQTRLPDRVLLALPPDTVVPQWLPAYEQAHVEIFRTIRMKRDYGPASKLLAAIREGGERSTSTIIVYGDDDVLLSRHVIEMHWNAHRLSVERDVPPTAFATRIISIGEDLGVVPSERLVEATGTVSVRPTYLLTGDPAVFDVADAPDACRLSDDYWLSRFLTQNGVVFDHLPTCSYDFVRGAWPVEGCGANFRVAGPISDIGALSQVRVFSDGRAMPGRGNWRDQLKRYAVCREIFFGGTCPAAADHGGGVDGAYGS